MLPNLHFRSSSSLHSTKMDVDYMELRKGAITEAKKSKLPSVCSPLPQRITDHPGPFSHSNRQTNHDRPQRRQTPGRDPRSRLDFQLGSARARARARTNTSHPTSRNDRTLLRVTPPTTRHQAPSRMRPVHQDQEQTVPIVRLRTGIPPPCASPRGLRELYLAWARGALLAAEGFCGSGGDEMDVYVGSVGSYLRSHCLQAAKNVVFLGLSSMQGGCCLARGSAVVLRGCLGLFLSGLCRAHQLPARLLLPSLRLRFRLRLHLPQDDSDSDSDSLRSLNQRWKWDLLAVWRTTFPLVSWESDPPLHRLQPSLNRSLNPKPKELALRKAATANSCPGHAPPHLGMIPML